MAKARPQKTLADYVAIGISPALIMVLVGSLVFFLEELAIFGRVFGAVQVGLVLVCVRGGVDRPARD